MCFSHRNLFKLSVLYACCTCKVEPVINLDSVEPVLAYLAPASAILGIFINIVAGAAQRKHEVPCGCHTAVLSVTGGGVWRIAM